jgi:hypothetical protein
MRTKSRIIVAVLTLFAFATSCKKELPNQYEIYEGQTKQNELPKDDPDITYRETSLLIDTVNYSLESTEEQLASGIYEFTTIHDSVGLSAKVGDVFLYQGGEGHLRKIVSIKKGKRNFIIETIQASMAEFFLSLVGEQDLEATTYSFPLNTTLYEKGPEIITVAGNLELTTGMR